jgi:ABC-type spermidine/putrescine transport system permease subunit I
MDSCLLVVYLVAYLVVFLAVYPEVCQAIYLLTGLVDYWAAYLLRSMALTADLADC